MLRKLSISLIRYEQLFQIAIKASLISVFFGVVLVLSDVRDELARAYMAVTMATLMYFIACLEFVCFHRKPDVQFMQSIKGKRGFAFLLALKDSFGKLVDKWIVIFYPFIVVAVPFIVLKIKL